jgi:hypothetical protein
MQPIDQPPNKSYDFHSGNATVVTSAANYMIAFRNIRLNSVGFTIINKQVASFVLENCISDEWERILKRVADFT